ncbi:hypothetical protein AArcSl_1306 [Halalkaliarchaeum desulfuricum]|uniref:Uncharacterized protein n=1 Tax=Halalkaliarchaeum desulfuricum TaxID=2055893 RepID=A0A343TIL5_9EURY|nr:hypothetical protein [Halalkaliarchaeum desulfuricum]AUX08937.1 hypothetical protein AArcSl_1306 [Halalkaliarchaeum desulfuricum]
MDAIDNGREVPTNSCSISTGQNEVAQLRAELGDLRAEVETLQAEKEQLQERVDELEKDGAYAVGAEADESARIEWRGDGHEIENLWIDGIPVGNAIANRKEEIRELAEDVGELRDKDSGTETEPEACVEDTYTPIERMAAVGDIAESKSDQRAVSIFRNFTDWGSKTPAGFVLRADEDNALSLLDTAREDDKISSWKQVHRAFEALEELSDGYIELRDDGGKTLVLTEQMPSMKDEDGDDENGQALTASSAGE